MTAEDLDVWLSMYAALFPQSTPRGMRAEIDRVLSDPNSHAICAERAGCVVGFAEYALRPYVNGCVSKPVPFLEGIWVDPDHRRVGVAAALISRFEAFARDGGYSEIGSDVLIDDEAALTFHSRVGFVETERVVYFRKEI
jgi:aminoglycoside 6'-N-acetyltransferase I